MSNAKLASLSVLIVEDIRAVRAILRTTLRNFGIEQVQEASDGADALELLKKRQVDIVITDICMAPMDGIEFTRRLRMPDNGLNPFVPVLMISSHTEISKIKDALAAGVTAFLAKPVTPASLLKKLIAIVIPRLRSCKAGPIAAPSGGAQPSKHANAGAHRIPPWWISERPTQARYQRIPANCDEHVLVCPPPRRTAAP